MARSLPLSRAATTAGLTLLLACPSAEPSFPAGDDDDTTGDDDDATSGADDDDVANDDDSAAADDDDGADDDDSAGEPGCEPETELCVLLHDDAAFDPVCPDQDSASCEQPILDWVEGLAPGTDWPTAELETVEWLAELMAAQDWQQQQGWPVDDDGFAEVPTWMEDPGDRWLMSVDTASVAPAALAQSLTDALDNGWGLATLDSAETAVWRSPAQVGTSVSAVSGLSRDHRRHELRVEHPGLPPFDARLVAPVAVGPEPCTIGLLQSPGHALVQGQPVFDDAYGESMMGEHFVASGFATLALGTQGYDAGEAETRTGLRLLAVGQSHYGLRSLQLMVLGKVLRHLAASGELDLCPRLGFQGHSSGAIGGNLFCRQLGGGLPGQHGGGSVGACATDLTSSYLDLRGSGEARWLGWHVLDETEPEVYRLAWQVFDFGSIPVSFDGSMAFLEPQPAYAFITDTFFFDPDEVQRVTDFYELELR